MCITCFVAILMTGVQCLLLCWRYLSTKCPTGSQPFRGGLLVSAHWGMGRNAGCEQEASVLTTGLLECPHDMLAGFP